LALLVSLKAGLDYEALIEASGTEVPAKLKSAIDALSDVLLQLVGEEVAEVAAQKHAHLAKSASIRAKNVAQPVFQKLAELSECVARIEAQPMPGGPSRLFDKGQDGLNGAGAPLDLDHIVKTMTPAQLAELAIKTVQAAR
jgi:hypothetical protein